MPETSGLAEGEPVPLDPVVDCYPESQGGRVRRSIGLIFLALCACGTESSTAGTENTLGVLVECDELIEEFIPSSPGPFNVRRHKVASVPVADPASVTISRCGDYSSENGGSREEWGRWSRSGTECYVAGSWVGSFGRRVVTFTPNFEVYVECEEEETYPSGNTQAYGSERVYIRTKAEGTAPRAESPLGAAVECNEVVEETEEQWQQGGILESVKRRKVAYVPVVDPTSVTVTRCGAYSAYDVGDGEVYSKPDANCVASTEVVFTSDSRAVVECEDEQTYPAGWIGYFGGRGGFRRSGYEHVYIRVPEDGTRVAESPLGVPVECEEVLEWDEPFERWKWEVAYVPVADPTSVTVTRCGKYDIFDGELTQSDDCVASTTNSFTSDFEVFIDCELERTRHSDGAVRTPGYESIYYRVD